MGQNMENGKVLVLGATGFIGNQLIPELMKGRIAVRAMVRDPERASGMTWGKQVELVQGDAENAYDVSGALEGIDVAYYLIHSMGGRSIFQNKRYAQKDIRIASAFLEAANDMGLRRVIYLGALGEQGEGLSEHLKSRAEVAGIISSGKAKATILRAAIIIGAGGASFEMLRYLVERLPVMGCPKWIETRIQPIAIADVLKYLVGCLKVPETTGRTFDIGGPEILTYREMMQEYAAARGLAKRVIFRVPFLTPLLSAYWVDLVTPVPSGVAHPLIDGLKNEVVCREHDIEKLIPIEKTPFREAVRKACAEETSGPGVTGF
jgi:uncharacterized protein YbjT (DUF2867 family)